MALRWRIALIWVCFLARLAFYSAVVPLWEGYDEWAHFSVIRTMAGRGEALVARDQPVPRDVAQSLQLAPVPWELRSLPPPSVTEDAYWGLSSETRAQREAAFRAMPAERGREDSAAGLTAYEALQPPLYYWVTAPLLRFMGSASLASQVLAIRWLSVAVVSLMIPLVFSIGRMTLGDERLALVCAAVVAIMPGLAIDLARAGNECLGVLWFTLLIWIGLRRTAWSLPALGAVLGLGLLTKAYFLAAVPAVVLWPLWRDRSGWKNAILPGMASMAIAVGIAGWWYWRNVATTGTLSGLSEAVMLRDMGAGALLRRAISLPWGTAVDAILLSHIYFGGWSSLTVRSWMYHAFYVVIVLAACGLWSLRRQPAIMWLAAVYALFWAGQAYNVVLLYVSKGLPGSMGWYLYAVVAAEVVLCTAGLARLRAWAPPAGVALVGMLDLYTVHGVAIPYYTGMIAHKPGGALAALHVAEARLVGISGAVERLTAFKAPWITGTAIVLLWIAYLLATVWLMLLPWTTWRGHSYLQRPDSSGRFSTDSKQA